MILFQMLNRKFIKPVLADIINENLGFYRCTWKYRANKETNCSIQKS